MAAYCLNPGTLAGIVVGTALGTALLFLFFVATYIYIRRRNDKGMDFLFWAGTVTETFFWMGRVGLA